MKNKSLFFIKKIRLVSGDDVPLIFDAKTKKPLNYPIAFIMSLRRPKCTSNTLIAELRYIMVLYTWALIREIDIEDRYLYNKFLNTNECNDLIVNCGYRYEYLVQLLYDKKNDKVFNFDNIEQNTTENMHKYASRPKKPTTAMVSNNTKLWRIMAISNYLDWLASIRLGKIGDLTSDDHILLENKRAEINNYFENNQPKPDKQNNFELPMGISAKDEDFLFDVIDPDSKLNPWGNPVIQKRNQAIIFLLFGVGMRIGEVLGLKIEHIIFKENRLFIAKIDDDEDDTRKDRPENKTRARWRTVDDKILKPLNDYITKYRTKLRSGTLRKLDHNFVFVSIDNGEPLTKSGVYDFWRQLKEVPGIPKELTTHTGRRNWNDHFSALCNELGLSEKDEQTFRNLFMGWAPNSLMAEIYSRRHILERARRIDEMNSSKWHSAIANSEGHRKFMESIKKKNEENEYDDIPF